MLLPPIFQSYTLRAVHFLRFCGSSFLQPTSMQYDTTSNYHKKMFLKLHCPLCRYRRISGRLHVECFRNPKHKQLEYMDTRLLWDDPRDTVFAGGYHKFKQLPPDEIERRKHTGYRKMLRKAYREKEAQRNAQQK